MTINEKDEALLALLRQNARLPVSELARKLNLSRTAVQARLQRLERTGVIQGYTVRLAGDIDQSSIRAMIMIKAPPVKRPAIEQALRQIPELSALYSISGKFDITAVVAAPSVPQLDRVIDRIGLLDGVEETQSSVILSTKVDR